ncbi:hypothetical protein ABZ671_00900 [Micromonospora sp. NPDC006766]|uniref:hypothetical protein n=1 Tax=Micromonospora sp. NPDC006766 TaxID=3154778 RepID=UPI0033C8BC5A
MRGDDLVPLLTAPDSTPGLGYRQGVVLAWNPYTTENTIDVAGAVMTNLSILNTSEALLLAPGDVVGILTAGPSWCILGRLTIPGTDAAATAMRAVSDQMVSDTNEWFDSLTAPTGGYVDLAHVGPQVTATISPARKALVLIGARMSGNSPLAASMSFRVSGASNINPASWRAADVSILAGGVCTPARAVYLTSANGLQAGQNTFTAKYSVTNGTTLFTDRTMVVWPM